VSIDSSPPAQPPQLSPDGKWVWDGSQWQPVVTAEPTHGAVFPSWNSIKVDPADPVAPVGPVAPVAPVADAVLPTPALYEPQYQVPAPAVDYSFAAAEPSTPLWEQPAGSGAGKYLYFGAGLVVLVMLMLILNSMNFISLPWPGAGSSTSNQVATPSPSTPVGGTEFARADHFLNDTLAPALLSLDKTLPTLQTTCNGTLSNACFNAINATDKELQNVLSVISHSTIPLCIAGAMNKLRNDFEGMHGGLGIALNGYQNNSTQIVGQGLYRFASMAQPLQADAQAVTTAEQTCAH